MDLFEKIMCGIILGVATIFGVIFGMEAMAYLIEKITD